MDDRTLKIVGLGDSTTAGTPGFLSPLEAPPDGWGDRRSQYAFWMMEAHPNWQVINCGINGQDSYEIRLRFARDVLPRTPDYVVILAGVNDVFRGGSQESVKTNLMAMYEESQRSGIRVIGATILPYNRMSPREANAVEQLNEWIRTTTRELGCAFCDTHGMLSDPRNRNRLISTSDGLHPDVEGYRRVGEGLTRVIEEAESQRR
ncbi:MAG: GDSL-type esterase/lipase family protein [Thermoplasmata archaeon]